MSRYVLLLLLGLAVWMPSIHNNTVNLDTPWLVVENPILSTGELRHVFAIVFDFSLPTRLVLGAEYLPVRDVSVLFDFAIFQERWWAHHLVNLVWYLLSCGLLLTLFRKLLPDERQAWLAAAIFMVHPVHVESVAWLASRKDVVSLALFIGAVLVWLRGGWRWLALSTLCMGLSYWAKNTAVTLPAILVVLSVLHVRQSPLKWSWWLQWIPYALVALIGLKLTLHVGDMVAMMSAPRADSAWGIFVIEVQVILGYLWTMVWPSSLSVYYPEPTVVEPTALPFVLGLLAVALMLVPLALWRRFPVAAIGVLWFFITLLPVSQIVPIQNLIADRYLLLPSAGLILAGVSFIPPRALRRPAGLVAAGVVIVMMSSVTAQRLIDWQSSEQLWRAQIQTQPMLSQGRSMMAGLLEAEGKLDEADDVVEQGLSMLPGDLDLTLSQGLIAMARQDYSHAEDLFRHVYSADQSQRKAAFNAVVALQRQAQNPDLTAMEQWVMLKEAEALSLDIVRVHPLYVDAWNGLGVTQMDMRNLDGAMDALQKGYLIEPMNTSLLRNLGSVAYLQGDRDMAVHWWHALLKLDPEDSYARRGLEMLQ